MISALPNVPTPSNEPILSYAPGTSERSALKAELTSMAAERIEVPLVIGGKEVRTSTTSEVRMPHRHSHVLGTLHEADRAAVDQAIGSAIAAKAEWSATPFHERAAIFLKAAELLAGPYRQKLNAATMLGQSKTAHQAEIDAACEAVDFLRFNVRFAEHLLQGQPQSAPGTWNQLDYRPIDGFVFAVAPFNFTSIALNLPTAPALMGNTVIFKPASTAALSGWYLFKLLKEAGLPDGVINFLPGPGKEIGDAVLSSPDLGGVHFTGSTGVFQGMWKKIGENIARYKQYPRLVGETGGKDFIFAHASAIDDLDQLATAIVRGGYEYQGQKCSACSRVYVPKSVWERLKPRLVDQIDSLSMGEVTDFRNFLGAVIDERSFLNANSYLDLAKKDGQAQILAGGQADRSTGWFIRPTLIQLNDPRHRILCEEIFAPIVGLYVYPDDQYEATLKLCDESSPYALTGAIFGRDRRAISLASALLRHAAGNFYINDKPTGAVVGQQPFGGSRASGTNDKAGSYLNLVRWTSVRTIKETFCPPAQVGYPFMSAP